MKQRSTRDDVAKWAGVSKTTVTYVLNNRLDIAIPETTRERVKVAAQKLGYRPHATAQALALGRTKSITVALPVKIGPHYSRVLQAFEQHTNPHGYHMIASSVGRRGLEHVVSDLWALLDNFSDGAILVDMPAAFKPYINEILPSNKPIVSMGVYTVPGIDSVEVALEKGVTTALDHLLAANPRRLAFFNTGSNGEDGEVLKRAFEQSLDPRLIAYERAMKQTGRPLEMIYGNTDDRRASMETLCVYVGKHGCPDALFCFNDEIAVSAHRALREMGFRIPQDVRLVGCDGSVEGEYLSPPLSTIAQPLDRMCAQAWEFLANRLSGCELPPQHIIVDTELIVRESSQR